jgi:hypothetical protein
MGLNIVERVESEAGLRETEAGTGFAQSSILAPRSCRVKICGITREEDARAVARSGADAIGLVFYELVRAMSASSRRPD